MTEAAEQTAPPRTESEVSPEQQARRSKEIGLVASSVFNKKSQENDESGTKIRGSKQLYEPKQEYFANGPLAFPTTEGTDKGNPLATTYEDSTTGETYDVYVDQITGIDDKGNYTCKVIKQGEGGRDDAARYDMTIPPSELMGMNLVSERQAIEAGFTGEEREFVKTYLDTIDPSMETPEMTDEMSTQIEKIAREKGMLTAGDMRAIIDKTVPEGHPDREDADKALQAIDGKTILDKDDFHAMMDVLGVGPAGIEKQAASLRAEITQQKDILTKFPDDEIAKRRLEQAEKELGMVNQMDKMMEEAREKGEDPMDEYFKRAQEGDLDSGKARDVIEGVAKGDFNSLLDMLPEFDASTPEGKERREKILATLKEGGKFSAGLIGILLGMALGISVSIAAESLKHSSR